MLSVERLTKQDIADDDPEAAQAVMRIMRSAREDMDPSCFLVYIDPRVTKTESAHNLRVMAVHELIHAILWDVGKSADAEEAATYTLQRALVGDCK